MYALKMKILWPPFFGVCSKALEVSQHVVSRAKKIIIAKTSRRAHTGFLRLELLHTPKAIR